MTGTSNRSVARTLRRLSCTLLTLSALAVLIPQQAHAESVVSACSGVSLPRSVVADIVSPVLTGITGPVETSVNGVLGLPLVTGLLPALDVDTTGLLNQAASGAPITLSAAATDGTLVGPTASVASPRMRSR